MTTRRRALSSGSPALLAGLAGCALATICLAPHTAWGQSPEDLVTVPDVPRDYRPATTAWGEPDLRGTWPIDHLNFTPLQRPPEQAQRYYLTQEEYAERAAMLAERGRNYATEIEEETIGRGHWVEPGTANRRTSFLIDPPDGRLPELTEEGKRRAATKRSSYIAGQTYDSPQDFDTWDRCITRGLPASMFPFNYNNGIRIFQSPGLIAMQMEMVHETRIIPTDGKAPLSQSNRHWLGESRGHWEDGNTLVVETSNFNGLGAPVNVGTWGSPRGNNTPQSEQARMIERFIITGPDTITYEVTYWDPVIFTAPWTARLDWQRDEEYELFEYACHEGNVQIRGYITSSRAQRDQARGLNQE